MTFRKEIFVSTISNGTHRIHSDNNVLPMNLYIVFENYDCPTINNTEYDEQQFNTYISNYINSFLERENIIGIGIFLKVYTNDLIVTVRDKEFYMNNDEGDVHESVMNYIQQIRFLSENNLD